MKHIRLVFLCLMILSIGNILPGATGAQPIRARELLQVDTEYFTSMGFARVERGGAFVLIQRSPSAFPEPSGDVVRVLDEQGRLLFQNSPGEDIPGASMVNVRDATLTGEGRLVVSAFLMNDENQYSTVLIMYDLKNGGVPVIVRTFPFQCESLHSDGEGGLWCAGFDSVKYHNGQHDYDLVHHYDQGLRGIGSEVPRSSFAEDIELLAGHGPEKFGFVPGNSAAILLIPAVRVAIRLDVDGKVPKQSNLPPLPQLDVPDKNLSYSRYAIGSDNRLLVTVWTTDPVVISPAQHLFQLDENEKKWVSPRGWPETISPSVVAIGVEGPNVVLLEKKGWKLFALELFPQTSSSLDIPGEQ